MTPQVTCTAAGVLRAGLGPCDQTAAIHAAKLVCFGEAAQGRLACRGTRSQSVGEVAGAGG